MTGTAAASAPARASFGGVLLSEWRKAASLRSTWWLGASSIVVAVLVTAGWAATSTEATERSVFDAVDTGFFFGAVFLILLGSVISTADFENNALSVFIAAVPRRTPIVLAKVTLTAILALVVVTVSTFSAFAVAVGIHGGGAAITDPDASRILAEGIVFGVCSAVVATSIGLVMRSTIATVGVVFAFFYVVPGLIGLVPLDGFRLVSSTFPGNAAINVFSVSEDPTRLDPLSSMIATVLWTIAWVAFAALWVKRRNA